MAHKVPLKVISSWSFSRWSQYDKCPLSAKLKFIDKVAEPGNQAMDRGAAIGKLAEQYITGVIRDEKTRAVLGKAPTKLPDELKLFAPLFRAMRKQYAHKPNNGMVVEDQWCFKKDWSDTVWNDWTGCWLRVKVDCAHHEDKETLIVTDFKTGKYRPDNVETYLIQLELYALAALLLYPHIKTVKVRLAFLDFGIYHPPLGEEISYTPKDIPKLKATWLKRITPMLTDTVFKAKPNRFCSWCWYRKANTAARGGPELCIY